MLVFDVTSRQSFERVRDWLSEVERHASPECRLMLLGNKKLTGLTRLVASASDDAFVEPENATRGARMPTHRGPGLHLPHYQSVSFVLAMQKW